MDKPQVKKFRDPVKEGHVMPEIVTSPTDEIGPAGSRITMTAKITGFPAPKVQWRKGQWMSIDDGSRYQVVGNAETNHYTMAIKVAKPADSGKYKLVASNEYGEVTVHFYVKVETGQKKEEKSAFNVKLKHREVKQRAKKSPEELEKEVLEVLKKADPKDYEKICMKHGFYDFRMILRKLKEVKREEAPEPEFEAAKVLKGLRHVTVNDEGTAVFEMHMENVDPKRHIMWFKDGEMVHCPGEEKRHELRKIGNVYQLIIRNVKPADAGNYTLQVGEEKFHATLTIKERPLEFDIGLSNQSGKVNGRCVFECVMTRRNLVMDWFKDGKPISGIKSGTGRIQMVTEGRVQKLIIQNLEIGDSGEYMIQHAKSNLKSVAKLQVSAAPIRFRNRLQSTEVKEKATAIFECSVSAKDHEPVWMINGKQIANEGRYKITHVGDTHRLFIENVQMGDNNSEISINFGESSSKADLTVTEKPIKLLKKLQDVKCRSGQDVKFEAEVDDFDQKGIKWLKDGKEITSQPGKYDIKSVRGKHTLTVRKVSFGDEGDYGFRIRGCNTEATLACTDPPSIDKAFLEKLKKNPLKFKAGTKAKIAIPLKGKGPMTVSWTNGRVSLVEKGRFHMVNTDNEAVLEVDKCKVTDSGEYELTVLSETGDVKIAIPVRVVAKPQSPSGEIAISDVGKDKVTLSWNPPIEDNVGIDNYVIEQQEEGSNTWKPAGKVPGDKTSFTATGLKEGKGYKFRVKAKNEEGESAPLESGSVKPLTPEEPPKVDQKIIDFFDKNPIIVDAGKTATINIPVEGHPPPSASWSHNDEEILPVKHHRAKKESTLKDVTLHITKCQRSDSGAYEAKIFNTVGGVVVTANLVVLDAPNFGDKANVTVSNVDDKQATVSWDKPEDDGGKPLKGYEIEKSIAGKNQWDKVGEVGAKDNKIVAKGLKAGEKYEFRVKAINEKGKSKPISSDAVSSGKKIVPPSIDPALLKELTQKPMKVKAGTTARLRVPVNGHPPPTVTWLKDGKPLDVDGKHVTKDATDGKSAQVSVHKCSRDDTAVYTCVIKNEAGEIEVPIDVQVMDVPRAPGGPITFSDISSKGVTISWRHNAVDAGQGVAATAVAGQASGYGSGTPGYGSGAPGSGGPGSGAPGYGSGAPGSGGPGSGGPGSGAPGYGSGAPGSGGPGSGGPGSGAPGYGSGAPGSGGPGSGGPGSGAPGYGSGAPGYGSEAPGSGGPGSGAPGYGSGAPGSGGPGSGGPGSGAPGYGSGAPGYGSGPPGYGSEAPGSGGPGSGAPGYGSGAPGSGAPGYGSGAPGYGSGAPGSGGPGSGAPGYGSGAPGYGSGGPGSAGLDKVPADVKYYVIEKREENKKTWTSVGKTTNPNDSSFIAKNIPPGKKYQFRVRAVNENGDSPNVESEVVLIKDPFDPPAQIKGEISMETATDDSITIAWQPVVSDGGSAVQGYIIEKRKKGTSSWMKCNNDLCKERSYTAKNLRTDNEYEFRVIAVNAAGEGRPSQASKPFMAREPVDPPGEPSDIRLIDSTANSLTIGWKGTDNHGGADLLGYEVQFKKDGSDEWLLGNDGVVRDTQCTIRGLEEGASYYVRVRSANKGAKSRYFHYKGTMLVEEVQMAPGFHMTEELETAVRDGFHINAGSTIRINVPYHGRPKPHIEWTKDDQPLDSTVSIISSEGLEQMTLKNVRSYHSGVYTIKLINKSGTKMLKVPVRVIDVPDKPSGTLRAENTDSSVILKWNPPMHDGGKPVKGYAVQRREARGRDWQTVAQGVKACTYTVKDITKSRSYYFRVMAENEIGRGEPLELKDMVYIKESVAPVHIEEVNFNARDLRKPPNVTVPLRPRTVPEGVKVTLSCSISGKPHPTIKWFKDGIEVSNNKQYFIENVIGLCRLVIPCTGVNDTGTYKVEAENAVGKAFCEATLTIK